MLALRTTSECGYFAVSNESVSRGPLIPRTKPGNDWPKLNFNCMTNESTVKNQVMHRRIRHSSVCACQLTLCPSQHSSCQRRFCRLHRIRRRARIQHCPENGIVLNNFDYFRLLVIDGPLSRKSATTDVSGRHNGRECVHGEYGDGCRGDA